MKALGESFNLHLSSPSPLLQYLVFESGPGLPVSEAEVNCLSHESGVVLLLLWPSAHGHATPEYM